MDPYYEDEAVVLYHGDCRDILPHLDANSIDAVITDPPYAVDKHGEMLGQISANYHEKGTHSRGYADHDREAFAALLDPAFHEMHRVLRAGGPCLTFGGTRTMHQIATFAEAAGLEVLDLLIFNGGGTYAKSKTTLVPAHEPATLLRKPGKPREINPKRNKTNLIHSPKGKQASAHPTTKPAAWMDYTVDLLTTPGQIILDPFTGSGSTLVAAKSLGRKAIGVEKYESFCELTAQRLAQGAFNLTA